MNQAVLYLSSCHGCHDHGDVVRPCIQFIARSEASGQPKDGQRRVVRGWMEWAKECRRFSTFQKVPMTHRQSLTTDSFPNPDFNLRLCLYPYVPAQKHVLTTFVQINSRFQSIHDVIICHPHMTEHEVNHQNGIFLY